MSNTQMSRESLSNGEIRLPSFEDLVAGIPYSYPAYGRSTPSLPPVNSLGLVSSSSYDRSRLTSSRLVPKSARSASPISQPGQRAVTTSPSALYRKTLDNTLSPVPHTSQGVASAPATPKSFFCAYCDRSFTRHSTYLTHENTHTEQHSYICAYPTTSSRICGRAFTVPGNTYRHLRSKHGVKGGDVRDYVQRQTNHASSHPVDLSSDSDEGGGPQQAMGRRSSNGSHGSGGRGLRLITE
ncbi:hypothetical protein BKA62DRAFT_690749 [Auriculariales sp. MPI-PUGE-AT-0066]|nr:hypothetical protein BKA62DRAFT_690749 [Auriculariales sp. MPI-PUGE-AT-0066]